MENIFAGKMTINENAENYQRNGTENGKPQSINTNDREEKSKNDDLYVNCEWIVFYHTGNKRNQKKCDDRKQKRIPPPDEWTRLIRKSHETGPEWKKKKFLQQTQLRQNNTGNHYCQSNSYSGIDILAGQEFFEFGTVVHSCKFTETIV